MNYTVLSPWAGVDAGDGCAPNARLESLSGKTVGLFAHFKQHSPLMLDVIREKLEERFPDAHFTALQYPVSTKEIVNDPEFDLVLKQWLSRVDCVISALGDAGSCTLFLSYNTAYIEKLGKPAVLVANENFVETARRGASIRGVPALRVVSSKLSDLSMQPSLDEDTVNRLIRPFVDPVIDPIVEALTKPLTAAEAEWSPAHDSYSGAEYTGTIWELEKLFYQNGWTNGVPFLPPTREAVAAMLEGTDLPGDYVVARIPPRLGEATVEKIAVNAVMAGCLPTYMPVLIAAVRGMMDPAIHLEGWTCSASSWFPLILLSGPIGKELGINSGMTALSQYTKAAATISRAFQMILMNIGGTRPCLEDMSQMGHENRFGVCVAEDYDRCPWPPLHTDYGIGPEESAVTLFWPHDHSGLRGTNAGGFLKSMCDVKAVGFDPGCAYIITPKAAEGLKKQGLSRNDVRNYICEYARQEAGKGNLRWISGNNHLPENVILPMDKSCSYRKFWNTDHLLVSVAGTNARMEGVAFPGGGDHGGPSCTKIELPSNWQALVKRYSDYIPQYVDY